MPKSSLASLPTDVQSHVNQAIDSLRDLIPPDPSFVSEDIKDVIFKTVDELNDDMRKLSLAIHDNPELGFKEFEARKNLVAALKKLGFDISNPSKLETAFVATYTRGRGGRTFGFNAEFDALPQIGHACGHNLIAIIAVASAAALKAAMEACDISGTVKVIGSPAEEDGGGKIHLLKQGIYDDIDACGMAHPVGGMGPSEFSGSCPIGGPATLSRSGLEIEFHGRGAHAGSAPWMGVNALDAAVQGYTAVSMLRQQLEPTMRVHGIILGSENWVTNIIPNYSKVSFGTRALDTKQCVDLREKVITCFKSAAESTGCSCKIKAPDDEVYAETRNNEKLAHAYQIFMARAFGDKIQLEGVNTASTDFGNVCYKLPGFHPMFDIPSEEGSSNHTPGFADAARTPEAHNCAIKAAKGLAVIAAKFVTDDNFANETKQAFEKLKEEVGNSEGQSKKE
ncbi:hypothetical protein I314_05379 [Cryptococcus bacillisporus CA1873]|uniref:Peptidase M20 domain-containing protein 2 n=2 Tax=Cryptococcus gattii TaxID=552467 RepID=A0A0D0VEY1_CRYGA|nr:hypothetical protein I312_04548 [Cryptococcus bacillisporus CA1280]KIR58965.1 hypothetical protein I314_05379 [Cryptococcus bacillisporus CA1873]|eukprot:KIR58965.1 hypothetical protein I314_05379 [Cryptococcus gattii CA1873]